MDEAEADVLAFMGFPQDHQWRNQAAHLLEQNDERPVQRGRYMPLETIPPFSDDPIVKLPAAAA
jgi:putative transposase